MLQRRPRKTSLNIYWTAMRSNKYSDVFSSSPVGPGLGAPMHHQLRPANQAGSPARQQGSQQSSDLSQPARQTRARGSGQRVKGGPRGASDTDPIPNGAPNAPTAGSRAHLVLDLCPSLCGRQGRPDKDPIPNGPKSLCGAHGTVRLVLDIWLPVALPKTLSKDTIPNGPISMPPAGF